MIDDPIKLREALYAAEPFLHYLYQEGTAKRNNAPLERALSMVRGVLDMDPIKKPEPINPLADQVELVNFIEHENGSVTANFEISDEAARILTRVGLMKLLLDAAEQMKGESYDEEE